MSIHLNICKKNLNIYSGTEISIVGLTTKNFETDLRLNVAIDAEKAWKIRNGLKLKGSTKISSSFYRINQNNTKTNLYKYFDPTFGLELSFPLYKRTKKRNRRYKDNN